MTNARVVFANVGSQEEAQDIGRIVVEESLAACVNILPPIKSIYRWKGKIEEEPEVMLIFKTIQDRLPALIHRVNELHSYDVPEIIALPIIEGHEPYLEWIRENV